MTAQFYILENKRQADKIFTALSEAFKIDKKLSIKENRRYLDTFDWRLYYKKLYLYQTNNEYFLCNLLNDTTISTACLEKPLKFIFSKNFPQSSFKNRLTPIIDIRALIPHFDEDFQFQTFFLLNEDDKKVVRLALQNSNLLVGKKKTLHNQYLRVEAIRGYQPEEKRVHDMIRQFTLETEKQSHFERILSFSGKKPQQYSSKIKIKLNENMTIGEALYKILLQFLSVIRNNEAGIRADIDTEFLHDYRVAIRRTRSLMSQVKTALPHQETLLFRKKFEELQKASNYLRDLDVYLLKEQYYKNILPISLRKSLKPLFNEIRHTRETEYLQFKKLLTSKNYRLLIRQWLIFLRSKQLLKAKGAQNPALPFAKKIISKRLKNIHKNIDDLLSRNPQDKKIHAMRIECKKLRYLLEFFSSLFPPQEIRVVIDQLKNLQDILGSYNDLAIQLTDIQNRLDRLGLQENVSRETVAAFGGLITYFYQEQKNLKKHFKEIFKLFKDPKQLEQYNKLFNTTF